MSKANGNPALERLRTFHDDYTAIPAMITAAREEAGIAKSELARRLKVPPSMVSSLEGGTRATPRPDLIRRIIAALAKKR